VLLHDVGQSPVPVITIAVVVCFYVDNRRQRARLKENGIDPRANRHQL